MTYVVLTCMNHLYFKYIIWSISEWLRSAPRGARDTRDNRDTGSRTGPVQSWQGLVCQSIFIGIYAYGCICTYKLYIYTHTHIYIDIHIHVYIYIHMYVMFSYIPFSSILFFYVFPEILDGWPQAISLFDTHWSHHWLLRTLGSGRLSPTHQERTGLLVTVLCHWIIVHIHYPLVN